MHLLIGLGIRWLGSIISGGIEGRRKIVELC